VPDLNLPPINDSKSGLDVHALGAFSTLYLQAELEQAGVIPAAESVVDARASLDIPSVRGAEKLEHFAQDERNWYDRQSRSLLFARLFGVGSAATIDGAGVNHAFEQLLATLCAAINRAAAELLPRQQPSASAQAEVGEAATNLLSNLELRQYGNTVFAARRILEQLEAAVSLLQDRDVEAIFHTTGFWPTLRRILEPDVPDVSRIVDRGQSGQHLIAWLAGSLTDSSTPPLSSDSPVYSWAAAWLAASGFGGANDTARRAA
jgi:hypothetical protein